MNKRIAGWLLSNGIFAILLYQGLINHVHGAWNVAVFFICFVFGASLLSVTPTFREAAKKSGPPVPASIDLTLDNLFTGVLAWYGHPWLAVMYILHSILLHAAYASSFHSVPEHPTDNTTTPSSTE